MKTMRIECCDPANETMELAIQERELQDNVSKTRSGAFVVYGFSDVSHLDMFKLGSSFTRLSIKNAVVS